MAYTQLTTRFRCKRCIKNLLIPPSLLCGRCHDDIVEVPDVACVLLVGVICNVPCRERVINVGWLDTEATLSAKLIAAYAEPSRSYY